MRKWNKLLALVLAMVMAFGLAATSFAADDKKEETTPEKTEEADKKDETTEPADDVDKKDEATKPADDADKKDEATEPTDDADKKDEATEPADDADKKDEATEPADDADKKDETTEPEIDYTGVAEYFKDDIAFVVGELKLIANRETGLEPTATMTRAEMVMALYNLAKAPAVEGENIFKDVADDAVYKNAVIWANANEVVMGDGNGSFDPDGQLDRQQIAVFLYRYATKIAKIDVTVDGDQLAGFSDVADVAEWAVAELNWAVANKLVNGSDNQLLPGGPAERQMAAAILSRYVKEIVMPAEAGDTTPAEDDKADDTTPAEDGKADDTKPAEDGKADDTKPAEDGKADDTKPAEDGKADDTKPAEDGKADDTKPVEDDKTAE